MTTEILLTGTRGHYRVRNLARSEFAKILSLRSTAITLGLTFVACLLVTSLVCHSALHHGHDYYALGFDATQDSLTGMITVALTGGVFGALLITNEYSSGTIRTTMAAAPRRPLLVTTKIGVAALLFAVLCELLSFLSFFLGQAILKGGGAPSTTLASTGAIRAVVMTGLFIALLALMSFGFGLLFRSTAAAIAAFVGVVFVLPLIMHGISESSVRYLPTNLLTNSIMATANQGQQGPFPPISPDVGLVLMTLYTSAAFVVGASFFVRRDT
jgi:ABC-2 type transport system permease protein